MTLDGLINVLVTVLLVEMMIAIGLGVTLAELSDVVRNGRLPGLTLLANYIFFPAITVGLLLLFRPADPTVSIGFLILAVCPGAPFGPPCTRLAGGNVATAVGLMAILAGTSALAAPLLLQWLLPLLADAGPLEVNSARIFGTLLVTQLVPLCLGLWLRQRRPNLAARLVRPAGQICSLLSLVTVAIILYAQSGMLAEIRLRGYAAMLLLLVASFALGWLCGGPERGNRKAVTLTTSLRNVGVGLVIATGNFANTAAQTAVLAYGLVEIAGSLLLAFAWGRHSAASKPSAAPPDELTIVPSG
jgi:BASS family bile acid:Na+ symporter